MTMKAISGARFVDPKVLARIKDLELFARSVVDGFINGLHRAPFFGASIDFAEHRGYVAGDEILRDYLIHMARPFLFSTSQPPGVVASCIAAIDVLEQEPEIVERLWENTRFFKQKLTDLGFNTGGHSWFRGDADGSGVIDFDDYILIDLGFNTQDTAL